MSKIFDGLLTVAGLGVIAWGAKKIIEHSKEEDRRKAMPVQYNDRLSKELFHSIVIQEAKKIKRLDVEIQGSTVHGTVKSVSGLSNWNFSLDFNDYGIITGKYWTFSENSDSSIPDVLGKNISDAIARCLN